MISLLLLIVISLLVSLCSSSLPPSLVSVNLLEIMTLSQFEMFIDDMETALELFNQIHRIANNTNDNDNDIHVDAVGTESQSLKGTKATLLDKLKNYQPKTALKSVSESCNQQLCNMYSSVLSCKVIGINLKKICAQYITSFLYDCSNPFPPFYDIYQAPFYCTTQLQEVLVPLISGLKGTGLGNLGISTLLTANGSFLTTYINGNFSENCRRNCYQTYINETVSFYSQCYPLLFKNFSSVYKLPFQLNHFQTLRDQVCVEGKSQQNCYDLGRNMLQSVNAWLPPSPKAAAQLQQTKIPLSDIHLYDPQCTYIYDLNNIYGFSALNSTLCSLFNFGNCYGNIVNMISTTQVQSNATALTILPPCLLKFLNTNCNLDMNNIANAGASANMSVFKGSITIEGSGCAPNVYDKYILQGNTKNGFLGLQGALEYLFKDNPFAFGLNCSAPLQTFITNFTYYEKSKLKYIQLTGNNGVPPLNAKNFIYNLTSNKSTILKLEFSFSIFVPGLNSSMDALLVKLATTGGLNQGFIAEFDFCPGDAFNPLYSTNFKFSLVSNYPSNPLDVTKNSASSSYHSYIGIIATSLLVIYYAL